MAGCVSQLPFPDPTLQPVTTIIATPSPTKLTLPTLQMMPEVCFETCEFQNISITPTEPAATATPTNTPSPTITPLPTNTPSPSPTPAPISLAFVGDVMLSRRLGDAILAGDVDYPFGEVDEILRSADYTIGNLETALATEGTPAPKAYRFLSPPVAANLLATVGFDLMTLANNHALDFGAEALFEGMELLAVEQIATVGAGRNSTEAHAPHIISLNGITLGFLSYVNVPVEWNGFDTAVWTATDDSVGLAWGTVAGISADVAALAQSVDHAIVILHSGYEYQEPPSPIQYDLSHAAINAGATLVVGHHAHILQGVETTEKGTIVYGLGNFAFDTNKSTRSAILHVTLTKEAIMDISFTPVYLQVDGKPILPSAEQQAAILDLIAAMSARLNR